MQTRTQSIRPFAYAAAGIVLGFAILHPLTMLMVHERVGIPTHPAGWLATFLAVFRDAVTTPHGWVWGGGYALFSGLIGFLFGALKNRQQALESANAALVAEKQRAEALLLNILPEQVAEELKRHVPAHRAVAGLGTRCPPRRRALSCVSCADTCGSDSSRSACRSFPWETIALK